MATKTYESVMRQIENLQQEADKLRRKELAGVIERIREAIKHYGITAEDLGLAGRGRAKATPGRRKAGKTAAPAAAKYRDEAGNTWVGRGKRPQWLRDALAAGRKLEDFRV